MSQSGSDAAAVQFLSNFEKKIVSSMLECTELACNNIST
jgi:hypothetical protein